MFGLRPRVSKRQMKIFRFERPDGTKVSVPARSHKEAKRAAGENVLIKKRRKYVKRNGTLQAMSDTVKKFYPDGFPECKAQEAQGQEAQGREAKKKGGSMNLTKRLDEEIASNEGRLQAAVAEADYGRAAGLNGVLAGLRLARRLAAVSKEGTGAKNNQS